MTAKLTHLARFPLHQLTIAFLSALAMGSSCDDETLSGAITDYTATPLAQESRVMVEIWETTKNVWVPMPVPQEGIEKLARWWCWTDRQSTTDSEACPQGVQVLPPGDVIVDFDPATLMGAQIPQCKQTTCRMRNEVCAGQLLEEGARSPVPREVVAAGPDPISLGGLLLIPNNERRSALVRAGVPEDTTSTPKIRFQPMKAPSRAAALRGALNRYRDAGIIGQALQDPGYVPTNGTCVDQFAANTEHPLQPDADGHDPRWVDVYLMSLLDAANQFSGVLPRAIEAMRESAQYQVTGKNLDQDEIATLWNGQVDSSLAVAKLLGYADSEEPGGTQFLSLEADCGGVHKATGLGPKGVPVCPPIIDDDGAKHALDVFSRFSFKPTTATVVDSFKNQVNSVLGSKGVIDTALTLDQVYAYTGTNKDSVEKAAMYQCSLAKLTQTSMKQIGTASAFNVSVPLFANTGKKEAAVAAPIVASHFTGAVGDLEASNVITKSYAKSGAIRALDLFKKTITSVSASSAFNQVDPKLPQLAYDVLGFLELETGNHRLEFVVGDKYTTSSGLAADNLAVIIHGVPEQSPGSGTAGESYVLVHTLDGFKCVSFGSIDGAPCNPADYTVDFNTGATYSATADSRMTDLNAGYLKRAFTSLPTPGNANGPILAEHGVYLLKVQPQNSPVKYKPFGGIVPIPGGLVLTQNQNPWYSQFPWATRLVITPIGGTYDEVIKSAVTPNSDDCSKVQKDCEGLPADMWPPLESELVGTPSADVPFERSFRYWLDLAKTAADEADKLGEEVLEQGLAMDLRREEMAAKLEELCGADITSCGGIMMDPASAEASEFATLGDKEVCLWKIDGKLCNRASVPASVPCPVALLPNAAVNESACTAAFAQYFAQYPQLQNAVPILVTNKLGIVTTGTGKDDKPKPCQDFTDLRSGQTANGQPVKPEEAIQNIIQKLSFQDVKLVAQNLSYKEHFADHYSLEYAGMPIFDTRRGKPGYANSSVGAPCNPAEADTATGSEFWSRQVSCFVSGVGGQCPAGVGKDGCLSQIVDRSSVSWDTEHAALQQRWAWGFGELRRAVATLGIITGELSGHMSLMQLLKPVTFTTAGGTASYFPTDDGLCAKLNDDPYEPNWVRHCKAGGKESNRPISMCVRLRAGAQGDKGVQSAVESDDWRELTGRPVNYNGFIPNLPQMQFVDTSVTNPADYVVSGFPVLCITKAGVTTCSPGGVDPQMPYCLMAPPSEVAPPFSNYLTEVATTGNPAKSSGYIGTSFPTVAEFTPFTGDWQVAVDTQLWRPPEAGFCSTSPPESAPMQSAVWRSLCKPFSEEDLSTSVDDPFFMHWGIIFNPQKRGDTVASAKTIGDWVQPKPNISSMPGLMLYDLTKPPSSNNQYGLYGKGYDFQYPLTQRNIFDAVELACHVLNRAKGGGAVQCDVDPENLPDDDLDKLAGAIDCLANRVGRAAERYVAGPLPAKLIAAFTNKYAIENTTGLGGEYLETMSKQYSALTRIAADYALMRDAGGQLALDLRQLKSITKEELYDERAKRAQMTAVVLHTIAQALFALASMDGVSTVSSGGANADLTWLGIAALAGAATADIEALVFQGKAQKEDMEQKRLGVMGNMINHVASARSAADDLVLAMNDLSGASADLALVQKQAMKAVAGMSFADYANDPTGKSDPQYVNVAMRKTMNTKLIRYENALHRAKQLAFLARRAIELRFGVDMQRMKEPLPLVEAPSSWVNDVCTMQGIDYAKIRSPNEKEPVNGYQPGDSPLPGDDFAHEYIGDYVRKLESFVESYPIKYPLKDGDDTAVISLADDVWRVSTACNKPSRNHLYFSTEFEKNDQAASEQETRGWLVDGCGLNLPGQDGGTGAEWTGCVVVKSQAVAPPSSGDGGAQDASSDGGVSGLPTTGLPSGAIAYRARNEPCIPGTTENGQPIVCPNVSQYSASGELVQWVTDLKTGYHVASVYALRDPNAAYSSADAGAGNKPEMRIIRESDGSTVSVDLDPLSPTEWTRFQVPFDAIGGELYRIEIRPSKTAQLLDPPPTGSNPPTWPSIFISAAQVEQVGAASNGAPESAAAWVYTNLSRDYLEPICNELRGPAFRKQFVRRCEYVCADGIQTKCAAMDSNSVPQQCFYEADINIDLERIENGSLIPSGQIAIGNFNFRHNLAGMNAVGTAVTSCEGKPSSCYYNGFIEYSLSHWGNTIIRNYTGGSLPAKLDRAFIEHGKMLAAERVITNPPSSTDLGLMDPYMKGELKGRPMHGSYVLRIWDKPGLRWDQLEDIQLVLKYHYWTRFQK